MNRLGHQDGTAVVMATMAMVVAGLLTILLVDLSSLYRATTRAQQAADAAALAAAAAHDPASPAHPSTSASKVAMANDAALQACQCRRLPVTVEVEVEFTSTLLHRVGLVAVRSTAEATLVRDG